MADSDRTERRLIDSIRRAKQGDDDADPAQAAAGGTPAATSAPPRPRASTRRSATDRKSPRPEPAAAETPSASAYQFGQRVWPD